MNVSLAGAKSVLVRFRAQLSGQVRSAAVENWFMQAGKCNERERLQNGVTSLDILFIA
jgi:hypothetical protein